MKLGYFTLGGFVAAVLAKMTGTIDVTWGWVYAPLFVHLGAVIVLLQVYRSQQRAYAALAQILNEGETDDKPES